MHNSITINQPGNYKTSIRRMKIIHIVFYTLENFIKSKYRQNINDISDISTIFHQNIDNIDDNFHISTIFLENEIIQ